MAIKTYYYVAIAVILLLATQTAFLYIDGRNIISPSGIVKLWDGSIGPSHDSQQMLDWYSFIHVMYGIIGFYIAWFLRKKWKVPFWVSFLVIIAISVSWEAYENSSYFIRTYDAQDGSLNYQGDSFVNSLMDTACVAAGFGVAFALPVWFIIPLAIIMEILVDWKIHDGVIISTVTFFYPLAGLLNWNGPP